jgi:hypothetical protein
VTESPKLAAPEGAHSLGDWLPCGVPDQRESPRWKRSFEAGGWVADTHPQIDHYIVVRLCGMQYSDGGVETTISIDSFDPDLITMRPNEALMFADTLRRVVEVAEQMTGVDPRGGLLADLPDLPGAVYLDGWNLNSSANEVDECEQWFRNFESRVVWTVDNEAHADGYVQFYITGAQFAVGNADIMISVAFDDFYLGVQEARTLVDDLTKCAGAAVRMSMIERF